jgi:Tfp pilus assembly protein PilF
VWNHCETRARHLTFLAVSVLMCTACTHQIQTTSAPTPVPAVRAMMLRQAKNAAEAGDGDLELRRLRQFLAANPKTPDARVLLARYYEAHGYPDVALEHYRLAAAQFPDSALIVISLAKTLRGMDERPEAVRALQEFAVHQRQPGWDILSLEGILEDEQGHRSEAETAHRAAVAAAPDRSDLHNNLGFNLLAQGRADAAIEEFRRAVELDPKSDIAHNNLATALARSDSATKDTAREAIAEWSRSTGQAEAHNNMAAVLMDQGRYDEARAELSAALSMQPDLAAATSNLQLLAEKDGRPATLPMRASYAGKRASVWARIFGRRSQSKSATVASQADVPASDAEAIAASVETTSKK